MGHCVEGRIGVRNGRLFYLALGLFVIVKCTIMEGVLLYWINDVSLHFSLAYPLILQKVPHQRNYLHNHNLSILCCASMVIINRTMK